MGKVRRVNLVGRGHFAVHTLIPAMFLLSLFMTGCSRGFKDDPKLARVKGKVMFKNQPVVGASVAFHPLQGPPAIGDTDEEGMFTLTTGGRPGSVIGPCKVTIAKTEPGGQDFSQMTVEDFAEYSRKSMEKNSSELEKKGGLPEKYSNPGTSGLEADVKENSDSNYFEYTLRE